MEAIEDWIYFHKRYLETLRSITVLWSEGSINLPRYRKIVAEIEESYYEDLKALIGKSVTIKEVRFWNPSLQTTVSEKNITGKFVSVFDRQHDPHRSEPWPLVVSIQNPYTNCIFEIYSKLENDTVVEKKIKMSPLRDSEPRLSSDEFAQQERHRDPIYIQKVEEERQKQRKEQALNEEAKKFESSTWIALFLVWVFLGLAGKLAWEIWYDTESRDSFIGMLFFVFIWSLPGLGISGFFAGYAGNIYRKILKLKSCDL